MFKSGCPHECRNSSLPMQKGHRMEVEKSGSKILAYDLCTYVYVEQGCSGWTCNKMQSNSSRPDFSFLNWSHDVSTHDGWLALETYMESGSLFPAPSWQTPAMGTVMKNTFQKYCCFKLLIINHYGVHTLLPAILKVQETHVEGHHWNALHDPSSYVCGTSYQSLLGRFKKKGTLTCLLCQLSFKHHPLEFWISGAVWRAVVSFGMPLFLWASTCQTLAYVEAI